MTLSATTRRRSGETFARRCAGLPAVSRRGRGTAEIHLVLGALSGCVSAPARLLNFVGSFLKASRSLSTSRFQFRQEPKRVARILFGPPLVAAAQVLSLLPIHDVKHGSGSFGNVRKVIGEIRNVVR